MAIHIREAHQHPHLSLLPAAECEEAAKPIRLCTCWTYLPLPNNEFIIPYGKPVGDGITGVDFLFNVQPPYVFRYKKTERLSFGVITN